MAHLVSDRGTYGDRLLNLEYREEEHDEVHKNDRGSLSQSLPQRLRIVAYGLLLVILRYIKNTINLISMHERWDELPDNTKRKRLLRVFQIVDPLLAFLVITNFLIFIFVGRYRSLWDRITKMYLTYTTAEHQITTVIPSRNLDFMNRRLVMDRLQIFFAFIAPFINWSKLISCIGLAIGMNKKNKQHNTHTEETTTESNNEVQQHSCGICKVSPITLEYVSNNCSHSFCYYCIKSNLLSSCAANTQLECPICCAVITDIHRAVAVGSGVRGGIIEKI
jgi:peroxin-2